MADSVDSMSNNELRTKLSEYGFPVMPVTASTRKILAKTLKFLILNKSKAGVASFAADRRSLAKCSSGEESDGERKSDKSKSRRATVGTGTAMLPPATSKVRRPTPKEDLPPSKRESEKGLDNEEEQTNPVRTLEEVETVMTGRVTKTFKPFPDRYEYETGSDSDVDGVKSDSNQAKPSSTLNRSPIRTSLLPSRPSLLTDYKSSSISSLDNLNSMRSRLGLSTSIDRPSLGSSYSSSYNSTTITESEETESPFLSNFTRRLSAMKAAESSRNVLKESSSRTSRPDTDDSRAVGKRNILKNNLVSFILVGIFCLFCLIFFAYYGMKSVIAMFVAFKDLFAD